jgi:hypothetical protein
MTETFRKTDVGIQLFHPINVGPFWTNALDLIGRDDPGLETRLETKVTVRQSGGEFVILYVTKSGDTREFRTPDNLQASYILNTFEGGVGEFAY